jgi:hypothetical protein
LALESAAARRRPWCDGTVGDPHLSADGVAPLREVIQSTGRAAPARP